MGKKRDENSEEDTVTTQVVSELKIYSESLNLRLKIRNGQRCTVSKKKKIDIKHTKSLKVLKRNIL